MNTVQTLTDMHAPGFQELDEPPAESTDPSEARVFDLVLSGLQQSYPQDKLAEISTSFCFICLLHLANERGLKLEGALEDRIDDAEPDADDKDPRVGNIWDLKVSNLLKFTSSELNDICLFLQVYRDPNAVPAA